MIGYAAVHWRGEHSLARSYWVNGMLLSFAINVGLVFAVTPQENVRLDIQLVIGLVLLWTVAAIAVWQLVGIWRSATNSVVITGRRFWPIAAKILVVLGWLTLASQLGTGSLNSLSTLIAIRDPVLVEFAVERRGSTDLILSGAINDQSVAEVIELLKDPSITILRVNSHGGITVPAIRLARYIRANDVHVMADGQCVSMCVPLLAASPSASIVPGTPVTFHRAQPITRLSTQGARFEQDQYLREVDDIYREFGVAEWAMEKLQNQEFWTPSLGELVRMNLVAYVLDVNKPGLVPAQEYCEAHSELCGD